jgi:predicted metal-binding protein
MPSTTKTRRAPSAARDSKAKIARLVRLAKRSGAQEVKVIGPDTVFTATWVRLKCQYGCGGFGGCLTCPPHSPTPETTRKLLDEYSTILLVHIAGWRDLRGLMPKLERAAFLDGFHKAFGVSAGSCRLCDECNLKSCVHPREARPSMEACGIDVYRTARTNGFPIEVCRTRESEQNYYGLLLVE